MSLAQIIWWCFTVPVISFVLGSVSTKALNRWMADELETDAQRWRCLSYLFFISKELTFEIEEDPDGDAFGTRVALSLKPVELGFKLTGVDPEDVLDQAMERVGWDRATDDEARSA